MNAETFHAFQAAERIKRYREGDTSAYAPVDTLLTVADMMDEDVRILADFAINNFFFARLPPATQLVKDEDYIAEADGLAIAAGELVNDLRSVTQQFSRAIDDTRRYLWLRVADYWEARSAVVGDYEEDEEDGDL